LLKPLQPQEQLLVGQKVLVLPVEIGFEDQLSERVGYREDDLPIVENLKLRDSLKKVL
jgi:hypothetical protein